MDLDGIAHRCDAQDVDLCAGCQAEGQQLAPIAAASGAEARYFGVIADP